MPKIPLQRSAGNTVSEYGLMFALVLIVCMAALGMLGGAVSNLLGKSSPGASKGAELMNLLSPAQAKVPSTGQSVSFDPRLSPSTFDSTGFITITIDRKTGLPRVTVQAGTAGDTNTTSVEGGLWNTYGSVKTGKSLEELAEKSRDPEVKNYLRRMSDLIYLMGGAQAELDGISGLDVPGVDYNNADALSDLWQFNKELMAMIKDPPDGIKRGALNAAMRQAQDAYNISQSYINALDQFIDDSGQVLDIRSFSIPAEKEGVPGNIIKYAQEVTYLEHNAGNTTLAEGPSLDFIKQATTQILNDGVVESAKVESTLTNAVSVNETSRSVDAEQP